MIYYLIEKYGDVTRWEIEIFKIGNDFDYFDLTFLDEKDVRLFSTFKVEKITSEWKEDIFALSKYKLQKNERLDFDSRCFGMPFCPL
ncbi:hypothetical protein [Lysinibacillus sp. NPDC093692]|uniref:hypothetical protein n=1 Tax=Lysinibacillus sp. NPDC093692 TaxID=3390578 RepID=UPI003D00C95F